jgi:RNA polymerase sigma factor (sigma-70 family)
MRLTRRSCERVSAQAAHRLDRGVADRAGFEGFYRENLARVVRACALVTLDRSAAEDVAADAFARLWANWGRIEDSDHAGGFVFKTAMRLCAKHRPSAVTERIGMVPDRRAADESAGVALRVSVFEAIGRLPMRQRQCVVLRDWAGFETRAIARMLRMRESTVRVHLARGRATLRHDLSMEERTDE